MKKLCFSICLVAVLALVMVGCGSNHKRPGEEDSGNTVYSSDYFGMEKGFQTSYRFSSEDSGSQTITYVTNVMSETTESDAYIYKLVEAFEGQTLGAEGLGEYIEKRNASYYSYGTWNGTIDNLKATPSLLVTNPITTSFNSPEWGTNAGQVSVAVPAGTFTAWLFERTITNSSTTYNEKRWFVPYLGTVKRIHTEVSVSDGHTSGWSYELTSYAKGVSVTGNMLSNSQIKSKIYNGLNQFLNQ